MSVIVLSQDIARNSRSSTRTCAKSAQPKLRKSSSNMKDYNDVLPSKYGNEDEEPGYGQDVTEFMGAVEQYEYVSARKMEAEKQWELIEKQIRLRIANCLQETLAEAKCKLKEAIYTNSFESTCKDLRFDSANLTIINSRFL